MIHQMEWQDFERRLDAALLSLASVPEERILIISDSTQPKRYVQFLTGNEWAYAEVASSKKYLPKELRLSKETLAALKESGWRLNRSIDNLFAEAKVTEPDKRADIAGKAVIGLRDGHKVDSPARLQYECFTQIDGISVAVPELGLTGHH